MNKRIQDPWLSVRSSFPCSTRFPSHLSVAHQPLRSQRIYGTFAFGVVHVEGGLGEDSSGSFAFKSPPLPPSCWVSTAAGARWEDEGTDPQEGRMVGLVCRGGFLCNDEKLVACSCFLLKVPPSAEPIEARGSWKKVRTRLTQCGRVLPSSLLVAPH